MNADKTTEKPENPALANKSTSESPPWNSLDAKPKNESHPWETGGRIPARTQRPEICDVTGWPALPSRQNSSSSPVPIRKQPWTAAKGRMSNKPPQQANVQLENWFAPLSQDAGSPSHSLDKIPPSHSRVRTESSSENDELQGKLKPGPQTLTVGDIAVKDMKSMFSRNTKVLCFPKDMVCDLAGRFLHIVASHLTVKNIVLHIGSNDAAKQQSEVLKRDFTELLNTVSSVKAEVFISSNNWVKLNILSE